VQFSKRISPAKEEAEDKIKTPKEPVKWHRLNVAEPAKHDEKRLVQRLLTSNLHGALKNHVFTSHIPLFGHKQMFGQRIARKGCSFSDAHSIFSDFHSSSTLSSFFFFKKKRKKLTL
jgi:hypothetical protein